MKGQDMSPTDRERETGPWQGRVRFGPGGTFAYRPGELLVPSEIADFAEEGLRGWAEERTAETDESIDFNREEGLIAEAFARFTGTFEVWEAIDALQHRGVAAQVNHVLFATVCCPPHPSDPSAEAFYANPFYANPFYANPFYANPFYANPFYANAGWGCGCQRDCCGCSSANPFYANPFYANPFYANPFYANAASPFADPAKQHSGSRSSSARPAPSPTQAAAQSVTGIRVAILDTGWAETHPPTGLGGINVHPYGGDQPDEDGDGFLDPAAGHGTFIAGIIEQHAPGCELEVIEVLSTFGDGDEAEIAQVLQRLADRPDDQRPQIVNLSFGGYSPNGMAALSAAIAALHEAGTLVVASAGNDATCIPMYPAALPGVVGVGAIDQAGKPAEFTNYGPWVRACAPGVDIVSIFFEGFNGAGPIENNYDPDRFEGWARWMGTSFSAPRVAAELARALGNGATPDQAVERLIDDKKRPRRPMLGAVIGWEGNTP
jgi:hypothetical protein